MRDDTDLSVVNIEAISKIADTIHIDGDNIVMDESANLAIARFKNAMKMMSNAESILKKHIMDALRPFNSQSIKGRYSTISISKPKKPTYKYKVSSGNEFLMEKTVLVPNDHMIDQYLAENGHLPYGVSESPTRSASLSIRLRDSYEQLPKD